MTHIQQQDWEYKQFIQNVQYNIVYIVHFLNKFETSTRFRLAKLNEKLINLERQMEYLEYSVGDVMNKAGLQPISRVDPQFSAPYLTQEQIQEFQWEREQAELEARQAWEMQQQQEEQRLLQEQQQLQQQEQQQMQQQPAPPSGPAPPPAPAPPGYDGHMAQNLAYYAAQDHSVD